MAVLFTRVDGQPSVLIVLIEAQVAPTLDFSILALDDQAWNPRFAGENHAQSTVRLHNVDTFNGNLLERRLLGGSGEAAKKSDGETAVKTPE